ncbi:MAG: hypothetical protein JXM79_24190 [Sedimentisphaerales bacterium]|nr:hypothetical protein [Sedimentisphaerales bacterium]
MLLGSFVIPASSWIWPAVLAFVAVVTLLVWSYRRSPELGVIHGIAFFLRFLGVLILALCLIEPVWSGRRAKSGANLFLVVADNSNGMTIRDRGEKRNRGEILHTALHGKGACWLDALADNFQLRQYTFDSRLHRTTDFAKLSFDGTSSAIGEVLRTIGQRYRDRPLAGVLLMTDGCATDIGEQFYDLSGVPPIYPVVIGNSKSPKDISLTNVTVSQTVFEDAPVTIQADVETSGYDGKSIIVELLESPGRVVESQTRNIHKNNEKQTLRFRLRPDRSGVLFYRLRVAEKVSQDDVTNKTEESTEATQANNQRSVIVDRGKGPYRILYVTGRPNWEYKFLRRAISEDEQIHLVGLLRVAKREPKYDWRGRPGEQGNPLYRGFDNKDEEQKEQYDQPVLVRLGTRDETELRDGFPKTAEELFNYHAVILDDIDAEFFSHDQMELLRRFVAERGGGFLMLGGKDSFQQGQFHRTPIGRILPVHLDRLPDVPKFSHPQLKLTREGWLQPWARLRDNEPSEKERLETMPEFCVLNRVGSIKTGALIVATISDNSPEQYPALVVQRYGNGRAGALTIGDLWRWGMKKPEMHDDMDTFWRQMLRWLVADVPHRVTLQAVQQHDRVNQPIIVRVRVRDKDFEPMEEASVAIHIETSGTEQEKIQLNAEPVLSETGLFEAVYVPRYDGNYVAKAVVTDNEGLKIDEAETGWVVDREAHEFSSIKANRPLLEAIARQTGGRVIELDALDNFARNLPRIEAPISEAWIKPLWDLRGMLPAIFTFVLLCFIGEWALRRWKGMP